MDFSPAGLFGIGLTRGQIFKKSLWGGMQAGIGVGVTGAALIGYQASRAGRGGFMPSILGQSAGLVASIPIAGFASAALCLIPGIGPTAAILAGLAASDYAEFRIGSALIKKFRLFTDLNKRVRHLEMGGNYKDTELAQRQRFLAVQDMNSSMLPARRYLGQEALLMHR